MSPSSIRPVMPEVTCEDDQHGMPWLQSWTNGTAPTAYVERDGLGTPLGLRIGTTDYAYVLDGLGSVMAVVGSNNTVAATYQYDPYGTATATSETGLGQTNLVRYAGGIYDKHTTLTKFGQRWYNPNQGRFTQQDNLSFIGSPRHGNRYAYAGCNPVNNIDPTGQWGPDWLECGLAAVGLFAAIGAMFTGIGMVGFFFGYGMAAAGVLTGCYDDDGDPVGGTS